MRFLPGTFLIFLMALLLPQTAEAKVGDRNWAACVWERAPLSADAWIKLTPPTWRSDFADTSVILAHKIYGICNDVPAQELKPNKEPKWKSLSRQLSKSKPDSISSLSSPDFQVLRCSSSSLDEAGEKRTFLVDIVKRNATGNDIVVHQQYFDYLPQIDKVVRIPQGLRIVPNEGIDVTRECQIINSDGSLTDA
ncbi:MAG: hypothetical protein AAGE37_07885 [Pseudomonadota bacterium]